MEISSLKKDSLNKELYKRLNTIKDEYNSVKEIYDKEIIELNNNNKASQKLNRDLEDLDEKLRGSNKRIYDEGNNIKIIESLQKEIEGYESRIDEVENELLKIIEMNEKLDNDIRMKRRKLHKLKKEFETLKEEYAKNNEANKQKLQELDQRRKKIIAEIDEKIVKQYNDIASKKSNPISQVKDGACTECGVKLNAMLYDVLRKRKQLCKCDNCGRILIIND